jgi:hypothetical protein
VLKIRILLGLELALTLIKKLTRRTTLDAFHTPRVKELLNVPRFHHVLVGPLLVVTSLPVILVLFLHDYGLIPS